MYIGNVNYRDMPFDHPGVRTAFTSYYVSPIITPSATTSAVLADRVYYQPFFLPNISVDRIGIEVTTGAAGNCRLGIDLGDGAGMPSTLLLDAGTVDTTSIAVVEASFTALTLPPRVVWVAAVFDATPTCRTGTPVASHLMGTSAPGSAFRSISAAFTYGTLPSTATAPTTFTAQAPIIFLRKS